MWLRMVVWNDQENTYLPEYELQWGVWVSNVSAQGARVVSQGRGLSASQAPVNNVPRGRQQENVARGVASREREEYNPEGRKAKNKWTRTPLTPHHLQGFVTRQSPREKHESKRERDPQPHSSTSCLFRP